MARRLLTISLFLLLLLVGLRPLVAERYQTGPSRMVAALQGMEDASPISTVLIDLAILVAAASWLISRQFDRTTRYRRTGLELPLVLFLAAGIVSCAMAADQRSAINATIDLVCQLVLAITLVQVLRLPWQRALLLAVILASASVQAGKCLDDHFSGFDDTWQYYQKNKSAFWSAQEVELDSETVELFERRMLAREASGFFPHSNVAGAYLVLCLIVALGVLVAAFRRSAAPPIAGLAVAALLAVGLGAAVFTTKSRGAWATGAGGLGLLWGWMLLRNGMHQHRKLVWKAAWIGALCVSSATIGYGVVRGRLPGDSLFIRWQYWAASASMFADHPIMGVGRENFGNAYLRYKSIESPEEVSNPHNLLCQFSTEMGTVGLIALLAACFLVSRLALVEPAPEPDLRAANDPRAAGFSPRGAPRRATAPANAAADSLHDPPALKRSFWIWALALLAVTLVVRLPLTGTMDVNYLYYTTVVIGVIWLTAFVAFSYALRGADDAMISAFTGVSLVAFLVHETVNFALFVPGSATTFCALLACWISLKQPTEGDNHLTREKGSDKALGACLACIVVVIFLALIPMMQAGRHLARVMPASFAPLALPAAVDDARQHLDAAIQSDPFDPRPVLLAIDWHLHVAGLNTPDSASHLALAESIVESHEARFSRLLGFARRKLAVLLALGTSGDADAFNPAIQAACDVIALYPSDPGGYTSRGDACHKACASLIRLGDDKTEPQKRWLRDTLDLAIASYRAALDLDASRPEWEQIRGLRPRQRDDIQQAIEKAQQLQNKLGPATNP
ncbi:MAG: O-antigen ligase family protein [Phycisphaerae bacterium]